MSGLSSRAGAATFDQLLSQTSGLRDRPGDSGTDDEAELAKNARTLADADFMLPGGTVFSYSNLGYSLAGAVLEAMSKRPYAEVLRDIGSVPAWHDRVHDAPGRGAAAAACHGIPSRRADARRNGTCQRHTHLACRLPLDQRDRHVPCAHALLMSKGRVKDRRGCRRRWSTTRARRTRRCRTCSRGSLRLRPDDRARSRHAVLRARRDAARLTRRSCGSRPSGDWASPFSPILTTRRCAG